MVLRTAGRTPTTACTVPRDLALDGGFRLRTGTSRRKGVAVLDIVECLRCHVVCHVLEGRVCRGGGARELEPVGAAVLEMHVLATGPDPPSP